MIIFHLPHSGLWSVSMCELRWNTQPCPSLKSIGFMQRSIPVHVEEEPRWRRASFSPDLCVCLCVSVCVCVCECVCLCVCGDI